MCFFFGFPCDASLKHSTSKEIILKYSSRKKNDNFVGLLFVAKNFAIDFSTYFLASSNLNRKILPTRALLNAYLFCLSLGTLPSYFQCPLLKCSKSLASAQYKQKIYTGIHNRAMFVFCRPRISVFTESLNGFGFYFAFFLCFWGRCQFSHHLSVKPMSWPFYT